jgi:alkanesulfonate monooxygenase SsuD/methylene tetrahydromethanopterin reductase-like flavin-dependent oxidoreductase (luciferase family)
LPRTLQQPSPPRWTTVVSAESARRAARRRIRISTGFNSTQLIKRIFDACREEADAVGFHAGPDYLALRRRVTVAPTSDEACRYAEAVADRLKSFVAEDERLNANVPDAPAPSGGFTSVTTSSSPAHRRTSHKTSLSSAELSALEIS